MKKSFRYILVLAGLLTSWYLFIWCKYGFFYKTYSQTDINEEFKTLAIDTPTYDSVELRGYNIKYLTNHTNKKPYLVLLHDSGKNAGYFLNYFKDKELTKRFHIIAIDRIGFGKTTFEKPEEGNQHLLEHEKKEFGEMAHYLSGEMTHEILENEGLHLEEVRIVSDGAAGILGLASYTNEHLSFTKVFLFNTDVMKRFAGSKLFSQIITAPLLSFILPKAFVNKQKDLLLMDKSKDDEKFEWLIKSSKAFEDDEQKSEGYMYSSSGRKFKSVFFLGLSQNEQQRVTDISGKSNFVFQKNSTNIYKSPLDVLDVILKNDIYTLPFNQIDHVK